jgi:hypothetical protein
MGAAIAGLGLVGGGIALLIARQWGPRALRAALIAWAWAVAAALLVAIPDGRLLIALAYAPLFLAGAAFGWPPVDYLEVALPWPVVHQVICCAGGFLCTVTALTGQRALRQASPTCGRGANVSRWTTPAAAAQWGRWAVAVAVVVPVLYAVTRWAWALGIPLGITDAFLRAGQASGLWLAGAGLATVGVAGALLTLGLAQRWGEVFPRWLPGLAGRRVPPALAIVPASLVAVSVTATDLTVVLQFLAAGFPPEGWATTAPGLLWPAWGVALGGATLAYYYRRRGACARCGRGEVADGTSIAAPRPKAGPTPPWKGGA